jgi:hypothetical protein
MEFTTDEISMLVSDGYFPSWMKDIQEGDLVAIAPVFREPIYGDPEKDGDRHKVRTLRVQSHFLTDAAYHDEDTDELVPSTIISFIGIDLDGLPRHQSFSSSYPCFIKRPVSQ